MAPRMRDSLLATNFTNTLHTHPTGPLLPAKNTITAPLTVCIIGASRGIGAGIAQAYAQAGAKSIVLVARSSSSPELSSVETQVRKLNPDAKVVSLICDITSAESVSNLVEAIEKEFGHLDVLVHNSGYSGPVVLRVEEGNPQDFIDVFNVNVNGTYLIMHYFIPLLMKSNGLKLYLVVNSFASAIISGHIANTAYCVSKMTQQRLVEFAAEQYGQSGLLAIGVHPGAVLTEMADSTTPESFREYLTDDVSLCGAFCVWLSRQRRDWMNGRLMGATWDVNELLEKEEDIVARDLLKFSLRI